MRAARKRPAVEALARPVASEVEDVGNVPLDAEEAPEETAALLLLDVDVVTPAAAVAVALEDEEAEAELDDDDDDDPATMENWFDCARICDGFVTARRLT